MTRFMATMRCDVTLQMRNGFYAVTIFLTVLWAALLAQAPTGIRWALPPMLVGNLLVGAFYFVGGLVLLEKAEGTPAALAVSPLRAAEYLLSKTLSLTFLALLETTVIAGAATNWRFDIAPVVLGTILASALYCLSGYIAVARYSSINEYLLPSGLYIAILWIPLMTYLGNWRPWLLYLHPMTAPMALFEAAVTSAPWWYVPYGVLYGAAWVALLFALARRTYDTGR